MRKARYYRCKLPGLLVYSVYYINQGDFNDNRSTGNKPHYDSCINGKIHPDTDQIEPSYICVSVQTAYFSHFPILSYYLRGDQVHGSFHRGANPV